LIEPEQNADPNAESQRGVRVFVCLFILFLDKNISYVFITMGYAHGRRTDVRRRKPFNI